MPVRSSKYRLRPNREQAAALDVRQPSDAVAL